MPREHRTFSLSKHGGHARKGFALLITITLLAFLVLLLVSLASLTRVETQVAANNQSLAQARQNALFGLNLALGQLQKFAGPDQAWTARADITSAAALRQPQLTGLWKPTNLTSTPDVWLVSGNESTPTAITPANAPDPATTPAATEVFLLGDNSVNTPGERIKLSKQPITAPAGTVPGFTTAITSGHYAYWIADQGAKTSVSLHDQSDDLNSSNVTGTPSATTPAPGDDWAADPVKRGRLRQLAQPRPRTEPLFTGLDPDAPGTRENLRKLVDPAQMRFVATGASAAEVRSRFHHVTALSEAVLIDLTTGTGRLKQDFSDTPDLTSGSDPTLAAFLRTRPTTTNGLAATYQMQPSVNATASAFPMFSLGPVVTEFAVRFRFYRDTASGNLRVRYDLQVELWNPYAATITTPATGLTMEVNGFPSTIRTSPGNYERALFNVALASRPITVPAGTTWAPGQIQVFISGASGLELSTGSTVPAQWEYIETVAFPNAGRLIVPTMNPSNNRVTVTLLTEITPRRVISQQKPSMTYNGVTLFPANDDPSVAVIGYGYELNDNMRIWTDATSGTPTESVNDPRRPSLTGTIFDPDLPVWKSNPTSNAGATINLAGVDNFNAGNQLTFFDLPRQEVISVGAFQQVAGGSPGGFGNRWGGSANDRFDRVFFSTLPRWLASMPWDPLNPPPLPNRYIRIHIPAGATPAVGDPLGVNSATAAADYLLDRTHAAKYLMQRGAFNINSTSIPAWSAVLGGVKIPVWNYDASAPKTAALDNAFFRLPNSAEELATNPTTNPVDDQYVRGARLITSGEVTQLATAIVTALRTRGRPYFTLKDFVNGDTDSNGDGTIDAVIADAIATVPSINAGLTPYSPGCLTQADVLAAIAPFITPRSDTFLVRSYGDVQNPATQEIEGRAWCEAVVQRLPDLTAPATGSYDPEDPVAPNTTKYPFGRCFKIVSFRWLSPSDL